VAAFVVCQYAAVVALNPEAVNLTITSDAKAGEEALAVLSFFAQLLLRLVPVGLGLGVVWGTLGLGYASFMAFRSSPLGVSTQAGLSSPAGVRPDLAGDLPIMAVSAFLWLVGSAALPILAYLAFLACHLAIDLMRTLLVLPDKLDGAARERTRDGE
jgi:hypothetical protein